LPEEPLNYLLMLHRCREQLWRLETNQ